VATSPIAEAPPTGRGLTRYKVTGILWETATDNGHTPTAGPHEVYLASSVDDAVARLRAEVADLKDRDRVISHQLELRSMGKDELTQTLMTERDNLEAEVARLREDWQLADRKQSEMFGQLEEVHAALRGDDVSGTIHPLVLEISRLREERDALRAAKEVK
jgi:hypothetical protein